MLLFKHTFISIISFNTHSSSTFPDINISPNPILQRRKLSLRELCTLPASVSQSVVGSAFHSRCESSRASGLSPGNMPTRCPALCYLILYKKLKKSGPFSGFSDLFNWSVGRPTLSQESIPWGFYSRIRRVSWPHKANRKKRVVAFKAGRNLTENLFPAGTFT